MSEEEIKELARKEILDTIKNKLDSSMIFTYINNLEQENKQLKETINKARNNIITDIAMIKKQYVEKPEIIMRLGDKEWKVI